MLAVPGHHVEFLGRPIVAPGVAPVVREPELLRLRMPGETDGVADAARMDAPIGPVGADGRDGAEGFFRHTDVAGRAHRNVEAPVGPEGDVLPAVMVFARVLVGDDPGFGRIGEILLHVVVAQDAAQLRHVERAVTEGDAVGIVESFEERYHALCTSVAVLVAHCVDLALRLFAELAEGADEERARGAQGERAGAGNALGVDADAKSFGQPDLFEALFRVGLERPDGHGWRRLLRHGRNGESGEEEQQGRDGEAHGAVPCSRISAEGYHTLSASDRMLSRARFTNSRARSSRASVLASQSQNRAISPFTTSRPSASTFRV